MCQLLSDDHTSLAEKWARRICLQCLWSLPETSQQEPTFGCDATTTAATTMQTTSPTFAFRGWWWQQRFTIQRALGSYESWANAKFPRDSRTTMCSFTIHALWWRTISTPPPSTSHPSIFISIFSSPPAIIIIMLMMLRYPFFHYSYPHLYISSSLNAILIHIFSISFFHPTHSKPLSLSLSLLFFSRCSYTYIFPPMPRPQPSPPFHLFSSLVNVTSLVSLPSHLHLPEFFIYDTCPNVYTNHPD